jgi:hypothetical protein
LRLKRSLAFPPSGNSELEELVAEKRELDGYLASLDAETSRATDMLKLVEIQIQEVRVESKTSAGQVLCERLPIA